MYHFGRCSADCLQLEVRCCLHGAFRVFGEMSVQLQWPVSWGLCHRPSHGGFFDQGIPEEVLGDVVCVAVGWPSFVLS